MVHMQHDGGGGGSQQGAGPDGLISPVHFPCRAHDLDVAAVSESAASLGAMGESVRTQVEAIGASWDGLQAPVYQGPEQAQVYALMAPAESAAVDLEERFASASAAIETYAGELEAVRPQLVSIEDDAWEFRAQALAGYRVTRAQAQGWLDPTLYTTGPTGDPVPDLAAQNEIVTIPWREHEAAVTRNEELLTEYARILERISTAATDCANTMQALLSYCPPQPYEAITAEQILAVEGGMPYGAPVTEDRNCTESTGHGVGTWWHNIVQGGGQLFGWDHENQTGIEGGALPAWLGVADFFGSTALLTANPIVTAALISTPGPVGSWMQDRGNIAATGWGSLIGWDHQEAIAGGDGWHRWQEDGVATGTEVLLNGATFFIPGPGWAAAGVRVGTTGARAAALVSRLAAGAAEFVMPAGAWVVRGGVRVIELGVGIIRTTDGLPFPTTAANAAAGGIRITPYSGLIAATADTAGTLAARPDAPTGPPPSTHVTDSTDFGTRPDPTTDPTPSGAAALDADGTGLSGGGDPPINDLPGNSALEEAPGDSTAPDSSTGFGGADTGSAAPSTATHPLPDGITRPETTRVEQVAATQIAPSGNPRTHAAFAARADLEPNTRYDVEGRGSFYTDDTGTVRYVEAEYSATSTVNWDLNTPQPNVTYAITPAVIDPVPGIDYTHYYVTDHAGRVETLAIDHLALGDARRSPSIQRAVGAQGGEGYDGAHLIANMFGGGRERITTQPWLQSINRAGDGSYYAVEAGWRRALTGDPPVLITDVRLYPEFDGSSTVPTRIAVEWYEDGVFMDAELENR